MRRGTPLELGRARLLAGVSLGLLVCGVLLLLEVPRGGGPRGLLMGGACAVGFGGALVLLRRASSTRTLALLLCSLVTVGMLNSSLQPRSLVVATHASVMLLPLLSVYLLGWRMGLRFSVVASMNVGLVFPLHAWGTLAGPEQALCVFAAISVLCAWAVGGLFISARDEARGMVERMAQTLSESEGKLLSIIQSTDDVVLSLNQEGRVVTANDAARQLFLRVLGRELQVGEPAFKDFAPEERACWLGYLARALQGERVKDELTLPLEERTLTLELTLSPIRREGERVVGTTLFGHDITARKESEIRLREMHRTLVDASRQAGMAELATTMLHGVSNTLKSVNASVERVTKRLHGLRVAGLSGAVALLDEHAADLGGFLTTDSRGRLLPEYLKALAQKFTEDRERGLTEMRTLAEHVEYIDDMVNMRARDTRSTWMIKVW